MKAIQLLSLDTRYALRALARSPGFTATAVLTLTLGLGANVAIFSVVKTVLLEPLPYPDPDRLVSLWDRGSSRAEYVGIRDRATLFDAVGVYMPRGEFNLGGEVEPVRLTGAEVSAELFQALGTPPMLGRTIAPGEQSVGAEPVVVLSHGLWRDRFGADPEILGRTVDVEGRAHTVVGVMPPGFGFPNETALWVPLRIDASSLGPHWGLLGHRLVGRLRPGATLDQATAELRSIAAGLRLENPLWTPDEAFYLDVDVAPLQERLVGPARHFLLLLAGAAALVLLIACTNVANLLLVRGTMREREIAVRAALGAVRSRLVRQLMTESLLLSTFGTVAGVALALAGVRALIGVLPAGTPRLGETEVDGGVLLFAAALALATGLVSGLAPALRASQPQWQESLASGARGTDRAKHRRLAAALVTLQVALGTVLVIGAALVTRSLLELRRVDPGFATEQIVTARVSLPTASYAPESRQAFWMQLFEELGANGAIAAAGAASNLPLDPSVGMAMWVEGYTPEGAGLDRMERVFVSPEYLDVMGIPVLRGRPFTAADRDGAPPVAYVDATAAARFWGDRDPVGGRISFGRDGEQLTVVGVVGAVKSEQLAADPQPTFYVPLAQSAVLGAAAGNAAASAIVVLRTAVPAPALDALRSALARLAPDAPISDVRTIEDSLAASVAGQRAALTLLGGFAVVALALGAIGTYGLMAWVTARRTRELTLRLALGAQPRNLTTLVARQGALLAVSGAAAGAALALALTALLRGLLFGVSPHDPVIFVLVPVLLAAITVLAAWIPARRAARLSPMASLRAE